MPCPTCDHTMEMVGGNCDVPWCPRCGTIGFREATIQAPMLVDRCRDFGNTLGPQWNSLWTRLGIEDSIYLPADRHRLRKDGT